MSQLQEDHAVALTPDGCCGMGLKLASNFRQSPWPEAEDALQCFSANSKRVRRRHSASAAFSEAPGQADEHSARKTRGKQLYQRGCRGDGLVCPATLVCGAPLEADSHYTDTHVKAISGLPVDYRRASGHAPVIWNSWA